MSDSGSASPDSDAPPESAVSPARSQRLGRQQITIVAIILAWTYLYNVLIKQQGVGLGFFEILDTISDDFVMGTLVTMGLGAGIVIVFSITKFYTQIIANIYSFKIMEDLVHTDLRRGQLRSFLAKLLSFEDLPLPATCCPSRVSSLLFSFSFIYVMSWVYVVVFSEALFFVSWSAGVDLPIDEHNLLLMPTLALAIPFSARVMAYVRYPYAQDYADFMPGAVFVLLIVVTLGYLFGSEDQKFFLVQVWGAPHDRENLVAFMKNGLFMAFIPVFFEGAFWLFELTRARAMSPAGDADEPQD